MINPLEQFLPIEERPDGVYIKIGRNEKDSIKFDLVQKAIDDAAVMNFEMEKFQEVVHRGRGGFERIGQLFEYYNSDIEKYFLITTTASKALLKISSGCLTMGRKPSEKVVLFFLKRKGVVHGIKLDQIKVLLTNNRWDETIEIAEVTPPEIGQDAKIEMKISIDPSIKPQIKDDGSVDYRNIHSFTSVSQGQVLAVKYPASSGKPGVGLNKEPIPSTPGNDHQLPNGKNTEISKDGKQLIASKTGIVYEEGGLLNIVEMLQISGDVDFNVGNIKYSGDVMVNGNVFPGFTIEADGSIHVKGDVESARIVSRNGRVLVEKGIFGKGDTYISAKLGIVLSFAQEANLVTEGIISFDKFILHCDCTCEAVEGTGAHSSIMGGEVRAEKSINVKLIGSDSGGTTRIRLFDKQKVAIEDKIKELQLLEKKLLTEMEPIEKQLRTKMALLKRSDEVTSRQKEEVKKWVDAHNMIGQKIKYVLQKVDELKKGLEHTKHYDGFISVHETVFPGTMFDIYDMKYNVNEPLTNKRFRIQGNGILFEG